MNMPGFTAEASLYREARRYQSEKAPCQTSDDQILIPQMIKVFRIGQAVLVCSYSADGTLYGCDVY
jgi:hypothetical protein